jgi:hypothetical protein
MIYPSRLLVVHPSDRAPERPEPGSLPVIAPEHLRHLFRSWDDLSPRATLWGIDASLISLCGYKVCTVGYLGSVQIPRRSIVVPVTAPDSRIVSLHDAEGHWFTPPQIHCTNMIRAQWSNQIEIFSNTIEADAFAIAYNVAAVALNGFALQQLSERLVGKSPRIVTKQEAAAA